MKKLNLSLLTLAFVTITIFGGCGSGKKVPTLSPESSFMSALGGNANLSTLTSLLKTPDVSKLLGGILKKPFTLLAPTNDAFNALGADALSSLTKPENVGKLTSLLKNHLVPGKLDAASLMKGGVSAASGNPLNLAGVNLGTLASSDQGNIIPIDKVLQ